MSDIEEIRRVAQDSKSMKAAARSLQMPYSSFKRAAMSLGCWKVTNTCGIRKGFEYPFELVFCENSTFDRGFVKNKLLQENLKEYVCEKCGLTTWLDKYIVLELHHKDGHPTNNSLTNLEFLCPNCHSQTDNFRRKTK